MTKGECAGHYTLYSTSWTIPGGISHSARIDVASGIGAAAIVDDFNHAVEFPGTCRIFHAPPASKCVTVVAPVVPVFTSSRPSPTAPASSVVLVSSTAVAATLPSSTTSVPLSTTSVAAMPPAAQTSASISVDPARPGPEAHDADFGFVAAAKDYFGYMVNYVANFFFG